MVTRICCILLLVSRSSGLEVQRRFSSIKPGCSGFSKTDLVIKNVRQGAFYWPHEQCRSAIFCFVHLGFYTNKPVQSGAVTFYLKFKHSFKNGKEFNIQTVMTCSNSKFICKCNRPSEVVCLVIRQRALQKQGTPFMRRKLSLQTVTHCFGGESLCSNLMFGKSDSPSAGYRTGQD